LFLLSPYVQYIHSNASATFKIGMNTVAEIHLCMGAATSPFVCDSIAWGTWCTVLRIPGSRPSGSGAHFFYVLFPHLCA
jgi:hypothetical protein